MDFRGDHLIEHVFLSSCFFLSGYLQVSLLLILIKFSRSCPSSRVVMLLDRLRVFFFGKNLLMESSPSTSGLSLRMTSDHFY